MIKLRVRIDEWRPLLELLELKVAILLRQSRDLAAKCVDVFLQRQTSEL